MLQTHTCKRLTPVDQYNSDSKPQKQLQESHLRDKLYLKYSNCKPGLAKAQRKPGPVGPEKFGGQILKKKKKR